MRWGRLIHDVEYWYDVKIKPIDDRPHGAGKIKEEYKEFMHAHDMWENFHERNEALDMPMESRMLNAHREAELADLFITIICYAHSNNINLKRAVYAVYLKLQKRKWAKKAGVIRHLGRDE